MKQKILERIAIFFFLPWEQYDNNIVGFLLHHVFQFLLFATHAWCPGAGSLAGLLILPPTLASCLQAHLYRAWSYNLEN